MCVKNLTLVLYFVTYILLCRNKGRPTNRIFTYVDHDTFSQDDKVSDLSNETTLNL